MALPNPFCSPRASRITSSGPTTSTRAVMRTTATPMRCPCRNSRRAGPSVLDWSSSFLGVLVRWFFPGAKGLLTCIVTGRRVEHDSTFHLATPWQGRLKLVPLLLAQWITGPHAAVFLDGLAPDSGNELSSSIHQKKRRDFHFVPCVV